MTDMANAILKLQAEARREGVRIDAEKRTAPHPGPSHHSRHAS